MDNYKQLYEKANEEYKEFYPLTDILSIIDKESGKNLKQLLNQYNHIKLDWKGSTVDTRNSVPLILRHKGLFVTYDNGTSIITEFYKGEDISVSINSIWQNDNNWTDLSPGASLADNEDIAEIDGKFKFADRNYNPAQFTGMGRVILRKNLTDVGGGQVKNVLTQDMINKSNTIYEIRYDFDLNGEEITIPEGCVLDFQGGSFFNGTIKGSDTNINGTPNIFNNVHFSGSFNDKFRSEWAVEEDDMGPVINNAFEAFDEVCLNSDIHILSTITITDHQVIDLNNHNIFVDANICAIKIKRMASIKNGVVNVTVPQYSNYAIHFLSYDDGVFTSGITMSNVKVKGVVKSSDTERYGGYAIVLEAVPNVESTNSYSSYICFKTFENISISGFENGLYLRCGDGHGKAYTSYINSNMFKNFIFEGCFNCLICQVVKDTSITTDPGGEISANIFDGFTVQAWGEKQETIIKFIGQVARNIITNAFIWDLFNNSNKLLQLDHWSVKNYIFSNTFDNSVPSNNIYEHGHDELEYINVVRNYMTATDVNPTVRGRLNLIPVQHNGLPTPSDGRTKGIGMAYASADDSNDMTFHTYGVGRSGIKFFTYKDYSTTSPTEALHIKFDGTIHPKHFVHFANKPFIAFEKHSGYTPTYNKEVYFSVNALALVTNYNGVDYMQDGHRAVSRRGTSGNRPAMYELDFGFPYFDTTLNKPIWWTGTKWVDATGAGV